MSFKKDEEAGGIGESSARSSEILSGEAEQSRLGTSWRGGETPR